jgi:hypothetical protein
LVSSNSIRRAACAMGPKQHDSKRQQKVHLEMCCCSSCCHQSRPCLGLPIAMPSIAASLQTADKQTLTTTDHTHTPQVRQQHHSPPCRIVAALRLVCWNAKVAINGPFAATIHPPPPATPNMMTTTATNNQPHPDPFHHHSRNNDTMPHWTPNMVD